PVAARTGQPWTWGDETSRDWALDPPLLAAAPKCPGAVARLVERCASFAPAARFADGAALVVEIDRVSLPKRLRSGVTVAGVLVAAALLGVAAWAAARRAVAPSARAPSMVGDAATPPSRDVGRIAVSGAPDLLDGE